MVLAVVVCGHVYRCACSCLVVPMSESALMSCAEASDLAATAEEEEELVSGSEDESGRHVGIQNDQILKPCSFSPDGRANMCNTVLQRTRWQCGVAFACWGC